MIVFYSTANGEIPPVLKISRMTDYLEKQGWKVIASEWTSIVDKFRLTVRPPSE